MNTDITMYPIEVQQEAKNLLIYATEEERGKLNFKTMRPSSVISCIYGQMIGNCSKPSARILMQKCNPNLIVSALSSTNNTLTYQENLIRGHCTPIEAAIICTMYRKYNQNLINYLRQDL